MGREQAGAALQVGEQKRHRPGGQRARPELLSHHLRHPLHARPAPWESMQQGPPRRSVPSKTQPRADRRPASAGGRGRPEATVSIPKQERSRSSRRPSHPWRRCPVTRGAAPSLPSAPAPPARRRAPRRCPGRRAGRSADAPRSARRPGGRPAPRRAWARGRSRRAACPAVLEGDLLAVEVVRLPLAVRVAVRHGGGPSPAASVRAPRGRRRRRQCRPGGAADIPRGGVSVGEAAARLKATAGLLAF